MRIFIGGCCNLLFLVFYSLSSGHRNVLGHWLGGPTTKHENLFKNKNVIAQGSDGEIVRLDTFLLVTIVCIFFERSLYYTMLSR